MQDLEKLLSSLKKAEQGFRESAESAKNKNEFGLSDLFRGMAEGLNLAAAFVKVRLGDNEMSPMADGLLKEQLIEEMEKDLCGEQKSVV